MASTGLSTKELMQVGELYVSDMRTSLAAFARELEAKRREYEELKSLFGDDQ